MKRANEIKLERRKRERKGEENDLMITGVSAKKES
jgi:hypothetical protein